MDILLRAPNFRFARNHYVRLKKSEILTGQLKCSTPHRRHKWRSEPLPWDRIGVAHMPCTGKRPHEEGEERDWYGTEMRRRWSGFASNNSVYLAKYAWNIHQEKSASVFHQCVDFGSLTRTSQPRPWRSYCKHQEPLCGTYRTEEEDRVRSASFHSQSCSEHVFPKIQPLAFKDDHQLTQPASQWHDRLQFWPWHFSQSIQNLCCRRLCEGSGLKFCWFRHPIHQCWRCV